MTSIAAPPPVHPLASLLPLHEGTLTRALVTRLRHAHPEADARHASVRELPEDGGEPLTCVTCLDGTLNLLLGDGDLEAALREMAARVEPGGLVVFDVDTASRHAWRLAETWVAEDPKTYICWEGKGADEHDPRIGWCDVYTFVDEGPAWRRTDARVGRRLWTDAELQAAAGGAGLEVVARYGQGKRARLYPKCNDARHRQAVYVLRRPAP